MTDPNKDAGVFIVQARMAERFAQAQKRADDWQARVMEERRALESLLDTQAGLEAAAQLDAALFSDRLVCSVPPLSGRGSWSDEAFWNAFDVAMRTVEAYEVNLAVLEEDLQEARVRIGALRAKALTPVEPTQVVGPYPNLRRSPRIAVRTEVEIASDVGGARGLTCNISSSGLFIAAGALPEKGALVDLALQLPDVGWLEARAVVRWAVRYDGKSPLGVPGFGVEFVEQDERSRKAVGEYLRLRAEGAGP